MLELILIFTYYFFVKWFVWFLLIVNYDLLPQWLNHKPFNCSDCLQTHMLWIGYASFSFLFGWNIPILIGGLSLTILNTLSIIYNQKHLGDE